MAVVSTYSRASATAEPPAEPGPDPSAAWAGLARALDPHRPLTAALVPLLDAIVALTGATGAALAFHDPTGQPVHRVATATDPATDPTIDVGAAGVADLPLTAAGRSLGTLRLAGAHPAAVSALAAPITAIAALVIDNAVLHEAQARHADLAGELARARVIQRDLLPRDSDGPFPLYGLNRPARVVSGDFFDYFVRPDGTIPFALGDVSGKGLNAALLMAKTAGLFRLLAKHDTDPARLLSVINQELADTASGGMFVTMVAGVYTPATGALSFANAGHEPPLVRWPDRSYQSYPAAAPPLGILPSSAITATAINLAGGEFYVFSDGLTEGGYGGHEQLGVDGLIQMVEVYAGRPLPERLQALLADLDGDGWDVRDDLTMLAIDDAIAGTAR